MSILIHLCVEDTKTHLIMINELRMATRIKSFVLCRIIERGERESRNKGTTSETVGNRHALIAMKTGIWKKINWRLPHIKCIKPRKHQYIFEMNERNEGQRRREMLAESVDIDYMR